MKVLVLGAYGNFGARICRALSGNPLIQLLLAGRDAAKAHALATQLGGGAQGVGVDMRGTDFSQRVRALGVGLVVHTAGPFQGQDYAVARAVAAAGAHYVDLADGRRFVCDFADALHADFAQAGRTAISGASTVPALSSAVVAHLTQGWQQLHSVDICIAPAQTAPRGKATLAAVLSYCGKPLSVWSGGQWTQTIGWAKPQRVSFARLKPRLGAVCDIPDLELFPTHFQVRDRVEFRAALEVGLTQRVFAWLAALRAAGCLPDLQRFAGFLNATAPVFDGLGTALGGMVVRVAGINARGQAARRAWHIAADHDHGPEIPCMAAVVLARRIASGEAFAPGAQACMGLLTLEEFAPEFARWGMVTDVLEEQVRHA